MSGKLRIDGVVNASGFRTDKVYTEGYKIDNYGDLTFVCEELRLAKQSRLFSFIEAVINQGCGFILSLALAYYALPLWGFHVTLVESFWITVLFTFVSIVRSYVFRRVFEHIHHGGFDGLLARAGIKSERPRSVHD